MRYEAANLPVSANCVKMAMRSEEPNSLSNSENTEVVAEGVNQKALPEESEKPWGLDLAFKSVVFHAQDEEVSNEIFNGKRQLLPSVEKLVLTDDTVADVNSKCNCMTETAVLVSAEEADTIGGDDIQASEGDTCTHLEDKSMNKSNQLEPESKSTEPGIAELVEDRDGIHGNGGGLESDIASENGYEEDSNGAIILVNEHCTGENDDPCEELEAATDRSGFPELVEDREGGHGNGGYFESEIAAEEGYEEDSNGEIILMNEPSSGENVDPFEELVTATNRSGFQSHPLDEISAQVTIVNEESDEIPHKEGVKLWCHTKDSKPNGGHKEFQSLEEVSGSIPDEIAGLVPVTGEESIGGVNNPPDFGDGNAEGNALQNLEDVSCLEKGQVWWASETKPCSESIDQHGDRTVEIMEVVDSLIMEFLGCSSPSTQLTEDAMGTPVSRAAQNEEFTHLIEPAQQSVDAEKAEYLDCKNYVQKNYEKGSNPALIEPAQQYLNEPPQQSVDTQRAEYLNFKDHVLQQNYENGSNPILIAISQFVSSEATEQNEDQEPNTVSQEQQSEEKNELISSAIDVENQFLPHSPLVLQERPEKTSDLTLRTLCPEQLRYSPEASMDQRPQSKEFPVVFLNGQDTSKQEYFYGSSEVTNGKYEMEKLDQSQQAFSMKELNDICKEVYGTEQYRNDEVSTQSPSGKILHLAVELDQESLGKNGVDDDKEENASTEVVKEGYLICEVKEHQSGGCSQCIERLVRHHNDARSANFEAKSQQELEFQRSIFEFDPNSVRTKNLLEHLGECLAKEAEEKFSIVSSKDFCQEPYQTDPAYAASSIENIEEIETGEETPIQKTEEVQLHLRDYKDGKASFTECCGVWDWLRG